MKNMSLHKIFFLLVPVFIFSCTGTKGDLIIVAAAANTRFVMEEQVRSFNKSTKSEIKLIFGSSGRLFTQIMNNAPFDIFLSADMEYTGILRSKGFGISDPQIYANGKLVFLSSESLKFTDIKEALDNISKFALANPEQAPYGRATIECLNYYHKNPEDYTLVYGSNVSETAHFLLTGAEYAFLPLSFLYNPEFAASFDPLENHCLALPEKAYKPINQGILLLSKKGREFYDYLLSEKAIVKWKEYGYGTEGG